MTTANVDLVRGFYAAFGAGDGTAALAMMAPDIVWLEAESYPYADRNPCVGPRAVADGVLDRVPADWADFVVQVDEVIAAGDRIVLTKGRYRGTYRATGKTIDAQMAHVWTVDAGKLTSFQQYADTWQVVSATRA